MTSIFATHNEIMNQVNIDIKVQLPFAITTLTQQFTNNETESIEAVYQFPLPNDVAFLGITLVLNDETYEGEIILKEAASEAYEEAIVNEDTAILLEQVREGIFQLNAGNLAPNDRLSVTLKLASLLQFSTQNVRYALPTVIAPRYGEFNHFDDLYQAPESDFFADYDVQGQLTCDPSLSFDKAQSSFEFGELLHAGVYPFAGKLDKDLVLNFNAKQAIKAQSFYARYDPIGQSQDSREYSCLNLLPLLNEKNESDRPLTLQLVIDCSGSMSGTSIKQAIAGISNILSLLNEKDRINLIPFGSHSKTILDKPQLYIGSTKTQIRRAVTSLSASMGGTEIISALELAISKVEQLETSEILLLTDGQIWENETEVSTFIARSKKAGCHITCIGLGNAVSENFLRHISTSTGGQAFFINPSEAIDKKIAACFTFLRSTPLHLNVEGLEDSLWAEVPEQVRVAQMNYCFSMRNDKPKSVTKALIPSAKDQIELSSPWLEIKGESAQALCALTAIRRLKDLPESEKDEFAVKYQQITDKTSFIMTAERDNDALNSMPSLKTVSQMIPNQYAGIGGVRGGAMVDMLCMPSNAGNAGIRSAVAMPCQSPPCDRDQMRMAESSLRSVIDSFDDDILFSFDVSYIDLLKKVERYYQCQSPRLNFSLLCQLGFEEDLIAELRLIRVLNYPLSEENLVANFLNLLAEKFDFELEQEEFERITQSKILEEINEVIDKG
jgi:uncharacterized protein YegL